MVSFLKHFREICLLYSKQFIRSLQGIDFCIFISLFEFLYDPFVLNGQNFRS